MVTGKPNMLVLQYTHVINIIVIIIKFAVGKIN